MSQDQPTGSAREGSQDVPSGTEEDLLFERTLRAVESEFDAVMGRPEHISALCQRLGRELEGESTALPGALRRLVSLLARRHGPLARALFDFLRGEIPSCTDLEPLTRGLLTARDPVVRRGAVELLLELLRDGRLTMSMDLAQAMARGVESGGGLELDPEFLTVVQEALERLSPPGELGEGEDPWGEPAQGNGEDDPEGARGDPVVALWIEAPFPPLRRLAARVLDKEGSPVPDARARRLLGDPGFAFLSPYIHFTRASHLDLLHLSPTPRELSPGFHSLGAAEGVLGRKLLADLIGRLGWSRLTWGLEVHPAQGVAVDGSWPFVASPAEADLLMACDGARRLWRRFLVVVHGGSADEDASGSSEAHTIERFRRYNVAHAEVLADLMEVAPLTAGKVHKILEKMEGIVEDFGALFADVSDDAARLPVVFDTLRRAVEEAVGEAGEEQGLSPEVTRLVQMFEDPERVDDSRTIHGLKRYLHQKGLRLAFRLFRSGGGANRFVDLVVTSQNQVLEVAQKIRYIEFEPEPGRDPGQLPFTVSLLVEALGRQLLYGQTRFPDIEVLGYGTEVQVYIRFRNHPVFLRIDLSPPLRGGMIDLEYFGVSQYELEHHPALTLPGIRRLFRRLDFGVGLEGFRLHLRYDKERALDLGDLLEKVESLFTIVPYLMDFDWIVGGLDYPDATKERVADAWAEFLLRWGVLPVDALLTSDRRKVLREVRPDPAGDREVPWDGRGSYGDRYSGAPGDEFWEEIRKVLGSWGLLGVVRWEQTTGLGPGQIPLEKALLKPVRQALARGEVRRATVGLSYASPEQFAREHAPDRLAELLAGDNGALLEAARLATLVGSIERHLRFKVIGSVNGHAVQQAVLPLQGDAITLFLLRDPRGMACLAMVARGDTLYRRRIRPSGGWDRGGAIGWEQFNRLLRWNNYLASDLAPTSLLDDDELESRVWELRELNPAPIRSSHPGEKSVPGVAAAPGRSAGFVFFSAPNHSPGAADILFAPAVRPEDAPLLRLAAGIVSTGGGALSHAGLVALELGKPALIVPGRWELDADGSTRFLCWCPVYREERDLVAGLPVTRRLDLREEEECLRGGELVVADADTETLTILGDGRDALAVHRELYHLEEAAHQLAVAGDGSEALTLRGRLLRTSHQLQKLLARLEDPALARHAVRQLLEGEVALHSATRQIRKGLLEALFQNPGCGVVAREAATSLAVAMTGRHEALYRAALDAIDTSGDVFEILFFRRDVLRVGRVLGEILALLEENGHGPSLPAAPSGSDARLDALARRRLEALGSEYGRRAKAQAREPDRLWLAAHFSDGFERIARILASSFPQEDPAPGPSPSGDEPAPHRELHQDLEAWRNRVVESLSSRRILTPRDGGRELAPLVGSKAANLGEVVRILGEDRVPRWFALTDRAFRTAMGSRVSDKGRKPSAEAEEEVILGSAIQETLAREDMDPARKSAVIRDLWQRAVLPEALEEEIASAYLQLGAEPVASKGVEEGPDTRQEGVDGSEKDGDSLVSIRSSAFEEDTERGSWAGAFDTFLFVRGREAVLNRVKRAWAGLWTERAILMRQTQGAEAHPRGGGLIVQRMVRSRVSGVVHTASTATGQLRDMVINAGLGLGEGVVSGTVEVDHILVSKEGDPRQDPLRFQYRVGDKVEQVVFDTATGQGTRRVETLYHQRLRPALEYVELAELVRCSLALEEAWGYPLDLEFAIQEQDVLILQARPVPLFHSLIAETLERFPFSVQAGGDSEVPR